MTDGENKLNIVKSMCPRLVHITSILIMHMNEGWLLVPYVISFVIGCCWVNIVWVWDLNSISNTHKFILFRFTLVISSLIVIGWIFIWFVYVQIGNFARNYSQGTFDQSIRLAWLVKKGSNGQVFVYGYIRLIQRDLSSGKWPPLTYNLFLGKLWLF